MIEDKLLIWKLKHGDKKALYQIYEKYKDDLFTIATSLLSETHEAEDVLSDVFITFAKDIKQFRLYGSLRNYLISSIVNLMRDKHREQMYQVVEVDRSVQIKTNTEEQRKFVLADERTQILIEALAQIPLQQREVIILHLQGGLKFREIADIQEIPINTVRSRYQVSLDKLRAILTGTIE